MVCGMGDIIVIATVRIVVCQRVRLPRFAALGISYVTLGGRTGTGTLHKVEWCPGEALNSEYIDNE